MELKRKHEFQKNLIAESVALNLNVGLQEKEKQKTVAINDQQLQAHQENRNQAFKRK